MRIACPDLSGNSRPAVYDTVALPTELSRQINSSTGGHMNDIIFVTVCVTIWKNKSDARSGIPFILELKLRFTRFLSF